MKHGSLFSGIGGFDLAAEKMEWENLFHCEWNEFGQKVLHYYWPKAEQFTDITKTDFTKYANKIDVLTGGFPCQPYSSAGKRLGKADERHLWPEMLRAIREIKPRWVVAENVYGLVNWNGGMVFDEVQADLEAEGYEVQPYILPAAAVNAPHRRDRVWFIAYANGNSRRGCASCRKEQSEHIQCRASRLSKKLLTTNANERTAKPSRTSEETKSNRSKKNDEHGSREKHTEQRTGCSDVLQSNSNTDCDGQYQCNCNYEINPSERGQYAQCNTKQSDGDGSTSNTDCDENAMHTNSASEQGKYIRQTREGQSNGSNSRIRPNAFHNFPTQSPICGRNDGLSTELDGITFPKWRNESIKAYGNAIVPQVALEIFKAIQAYENQLNQ